ncbi:MAG: hypothetical protein H3C45_01495 [Bacteroidia bacterium]|nr:hypothetical protein [Bacteroidia bacterium]MCC7533306.1 hypothetical protein [Bacteroidia bacterium]
MNVTLNRDKPIVRLRAFRAIDDETSCELFIDGHTRVLTSIGVTKVSSAKHEWMYNPAVFVLIVESLDGSTVYGGARINVAGGTQPLPIEEATGMLDDKIYELVKRYAKSGTGEICGLWNSREIAGYGIGSIFLTRAAVAIAKQVGLKSLFALCAPYTVSMAEQVGYSKETSIGNSGTFYYPKLDLIATAMILHDVETLSLAMPEDRDAIMLLRNEPDIVKVETLRNKEIEIHYATSIHRIEEWDLDSIINNSQIVNFKTKQSDGTINIQ